MGSKFFEIRTRICLEQDEAAEALGVDVETIVAYDKGTERPEQPLPWVRTTLKSHLESISGECDNRFSGFLILNGFRTFFGYSLERTAKLFGYTPEQWRRFELNQEQLPEKVLARVGRAYDKRVQLQLAKAFRKLF